MSDTSTRSLLPGIGFGMAAGALWGAVFLAPKLLEGFSPFLIAVARYLTYGAISVLGLIPYWKGIHSRLTSYDIRISLGLGLGGNLAYYTCLGLAVQLAGVAAASLLIGLLPVTISLCGGKDHGALSLKKLILPLILITAGVFCINLDLFLFSPPTPHSTAEKAFGILFAFCALALWTAWAVGNARYLERHPKWTSHEWSLLGGVSTGAVAVIAILPCLAFLPAGHPNFTRFWFVTIAIALGASTIGNGLWNAASRRLPLTLLGKMIAFETLFALAYGFCYDHRWPRPLEIAAIVLLAGGVAWSAHRHTKKGFAPPAQAAS